MVDSFVGRRGLLLAMPLVVGASVFIFAACSGDEPAGHPSGTDGGTEAAAAAETGVASAPACAPKMPDEGTFPDSTCPIHKPSQPDSFDEALATVGLDRCSLGFTAKDFSIFPASTTHDAYRLPWYDAVHDHAVRAPAFANMLMASLDDAATSPSPVTGALQVAAFGLGATAVPCLTPFAIDESQPLARAVAQLIRNANGNPDDAALEADAADLPKPLQNALAAVVLAASEANEAWVKLAASLSAEDRMTLGVVPGMTLRLKSGLRPTVTDAQVQTLLATRFDEKALAEGAIVLAMRIAAAKLASFTGARGFEFAQDTPLGRIVVSDAADHTHDEPSHVLLLVDTGGNDTYLYPAGGVDGTLAGAHHVGLAIDLGGRDAYTYKEAADTADGARLPSDGSGRYHSTHALTEDDGPVSFSEIMRQGAARLGYGMLFDYGTDTDTYRSLRLSQGYGAAGVGVLFDEGGDDVYEGEAGVQGASHFGIGVLVDGSGNDIYRSYSQTQGFSYVRGVGILYDGDGDDQYLVNHGDPSEGGDPLYWSVQIPGKGNNSFAQGSAWGRRSPGTNGDAVRMSGGLGILRDRRGNDTYVASVQSQGSGYWFGTGILADGAGNDSYDARYYTQGSGAHFALAIFLEGGGDDRYNTNLTTKATSIGVGHDFTVGWHIDLGGNDVYHAPSLSLGSGNANGIGILINVGGDDVYKVAGEPSLGAGNLSSEVHESVPRQGVPTTGIFMDIGGHDVYDLPSTVTRGNDVSWINNREPPDSGLTTEHGAGVDRADGGISFP